MKHVRIGLIGCGGMARQHLSYFDKLPDLKLAAACDIDSAAAKFVGDKYHVPTFTDGMELISSGLVDAILIASIHYTHPPLTIAGFKHGLHVLCEKPVAVTAKAAAEMNAAHAKHPELVFCVMLNLRVHPTWKRIKQVVAEGMLGNIIRVNWITTNWFRSQFYYDSGSWRATWKGEGGGVLLNQTPHILDLLTWITGMPRRVTALVGVGKYHHIEVEDEVSALLEYENGATGVFVASTGEAPGTNRLEIAGDKGRLVTDGGKRIELTLNTVPAAQFCRETRDRFATPGTEQTVIEVGGQDPAHQGITRNFVDAILDKAPLIAPGEEGIKELELGNAMLMSGMTGKPIEIPTDRGAYERMIQKLARQSKFKKNVVKGEIKNDMGGSFNASGPSTR